MFATLTIPPRKVHPYFAGAPGKHFAEPFFA
jgi:hypothetical protein